MLFAVDGDRVRVVIQEREVEEWSRALREDPEEAKKRLPGERTDREGEGGIGNGGDETVRRNDPASAGRTGEGAPSAWVEEAGGYLSIPEVEISGPEEFMEEFVNKSKPAVIKVRTYCGGLMYNLVMGKGHEVFAVGVEVPTPCCLARAREIIDS